MPTPFPLGIVPLQHGNVLALALEQYPDLALGPLCCTCLPSLAEAPCQHDILPGPVDLIPGPQPGGRRDHGPHSNMA